MIRVHSKLASFLFGLCLLFFIFFVVPALGILLVAPLLNLYVNFFFWLGGLQ